MIVVVYRKSENARKKYMKVFINHQTPDVIINGRARKPLIPDGYVIDELGMGESFIQVYKKQHNIKNHETIK